MDELKIPPDWRKRVETIVALGLLFIEKRKTLSPSAFNKWVEKEFGLQTHSAHRIMAVSRNAVLSDPQYWGALPPQWGKLYELTRLPNERLLEKIADGTVGQSKYDIWVERGLATREDYVLRNRRYARQRKPKQKTINGYRPLPVKSFKSSLSFILTACMAADDLRFPFLEPDDQNSLIQDLEEAQQSLIALQRNIRRNKGYERESKKLHGKGSKAGVDSDKKSGRRVAGGTAPVQGKVGEGNS